MIIQHRRKTASLLANADHLLIEGGLDLSERFVKEVERAQVLLG